MGDHPGFVGRKNLATHTRVPNRPYQPSQPYCINPLPAYRLMTLAVKALNLKDKNHKKCKDIKH